MAREDAAALQLSVRSWSHFARTPTAGKWCGGQMFPAICAPEQCCSFCKPHVAPSRHVYRLYCLHTVLHLQQLLRIILLKFLLLTTLEHMQYWLCFVASDGGLHIDISVCISAGPDMAFMQHYMQMAAGHVDPTVLQMAQYHMAAAHGLNFPGFPGFPPPGIAEQVMAAYAAQAAASFTPACFPPFPPTEQRQDPAQLAQQQAAAAAAAAALASTLYAQQPPQAQHQAAAQHTSAPSTEASVQAATANPFALTQAAAAYQGAVPAFHQPAERGSPQAGLHQESRQQSLPQNGRFAQQPAKPADSSPRDTQQGLSLLPARLPVKDDPAFGNGRLYRPQASHAKPSVAPPSTKFGGAMNDNPQSGSVLSTNSSSESVLPPAGCCFEAAGKHTRPLQS